MRSGPIFGGSEWHMGIVGASTLESGGPMGEVDWNGRSIVGGRAWSSSQCELSRSCAELCGVVQRWFMWWCRVYSPPVRAYTFRNTLPPPWACTICCAEPIRHGANQHVDGGGGVVVQLCGTSASTTDNAKRVGFIEDEAVLIPLLELELGNAISNNMMRRRRNLRVLACQS